MRHSALAALCVFLLAGPAVAQYVPYGSLGEVPVGADSYPPQLIYPPSPWVSLEPTCQPPSFEVADSDSCASGDASGWTAAAEWLALRPFESEGEVTTNKFQSALRLTVGWEASSGLGIRARWFDYDVANRDFRDIANDFQLEVVDVEITDRFKLGTETKGLLTFGLRYAEFVDGDEVSIEGSGGPVVGVELNRNLSNNTSLYVLGRQSLQYGTANFPDSPSENRVFGITELELGAEWHYPLSCGGSAFVRGGLVAQCWTGPNDDDSEDFGVLGSTLAIGLSR